MHFTEVLPGASIHRRTKRAEDVEGDTPSRPRMAPLSQGFFTS